MPAPSRAIRRGRAPPEGGPGASSWTADGDGSTVGRAADRNRQRHVIAGRRRGGDHDVDLVKAGKPGRDSRKHDDSGHSADAYFRRFNGPVKNAAVRRSYIAGA